ncbi:putative cuticle collagen 91 [Phyllostomus hastatus]|uniref:putative cuticle collagen 91 n=1 Tax=Phyllostomus hastatus TaxID=9423 RepID=UPI001E681633|nr:putative cuticle collagen 91 [Phyllostomus hastatus]
MAAAPPAAAAEAGEGPGEGGAGVASRRGWPCQGTHLPLKRTELGGASKPLAEPGQECAASAGPGSGGRGRADPGPGSPVGGRPESRSCLEPGFPGEPAARNPEAAHCGGPRGARTPPSEQTRLGTEGGGRLRCTLSSQRGSRQRPAGPALVTEQWTRTDPVQANGGSRGHGGTSRQPGGGRGLRGGGLDQPRGDAGPQRGTAQPPPMSWRQRRGTRLFPCACMLLTQRPHTCTMKKSGNVHTRRHGGKRLNTLCRRGRSPSGTSGRAGGGVCLSLCPSVRTPQRLHLLSHCAPCSTAFSRGTTSNGLIAPSVLE